MRNKGNQSRWIARKYDENYIHSRILKRYCISLIIRVLHEQGSCIKACGMLMTHYAAQTLDLLYPYSVGRFSICFFQSQSPHLMSPHQWPSSKAAKNYRHIRASGIPYRAKLCRENFSSLNEKCVTFARRKVSPDKIYRWL